MTIGFTLNAVWAVFSLWLTWRISRRQTHVVWKHLNTRFASLGLCTVPAIARFNVPAFDDTDFALWMAANFFFQMTASQIIVFWFNRKIKRQALVSTESARQDTLN